MVLIKTMEKFSQVIGHKMMPHLVANDQTSLIFIHTYIYIH